MSDLPSPDIAKAIAAIGAQQANDDQFKPDAHAEMFKEAEPSLATFLGEPQLDVLARQYIRNDADATLRQSLFKTTMIRANLAVLAATIFGGLMMAGQIGAASYPVLQNLVIVCGLLGGVAATVGSMWLFRAREGNLLEDWMQTRAKAEASRNEYFKVLAKLPAAPAESLLCLEYFRRYQIELQCNYFGKRAGQYRKSAEKTLRLGGYAVALSSLSGLGGGILGLSGGSPAWTSLGALSVIGGALSAYANAYESMNQGRRNALRYEQTLESLEMLKARIGETRKAIAAGNAEALTAFVAAVNEQLSLHHRQWMEASEGVKSVMATLSAALAPKPEPASGKET